MEARNLTWIGLAMVLVVVLGFVTLGIVLKFHGWPDQTMFRFHPLASGLRLYGAWLMLLPLLWAIYAAIAVPIDKGILSAGLVEAVGAALVGILLLAFLIAVANPGVRPLFRGVTSGAPASR